ncbi:MAG: DUF3253 domain-containing protein [Oxalobacteraceae bacterium]|nr:MAG: DUF3253 domain-containing protein [Oxalobacteraceae bacterium]
MDAEYACRETLTLLACRAAGATICPSEVARALAANAADKPAAMNWRDAMPVVHAAIDQLVTEGWVQLSWKGELLTARVGPYRIRYVHELERG